jgi:hypothetical protein
MDVWWKPNSWSAFELGVRTGGSRSSLAGCKGAGLAGKRGNVPWVVAIFKLGVRVRVRVRGRVRVRVRIRLSGRGRGRDDVPWVVAVLKLSIKVIGMIDHVSKRGSVHGKRPVSPDGSG